MMLPSVWSSLFSVNKQAFGTLVSLFILIFFSPSNKRNDSKAGGAFILNIRSTTSPLLTLAAQPVAHEYACASWPPFCNATYGNLHKTNFMNTMPGSLMMRFFLSIYRTCVYVRVVSVCVCVLCFDCPLILAFFQLTPFLWFAGLCLFLNAGRWLVDSVRKCPFKPGAGAWLFLNPEDQTPVRIVAHRYAVLEHSVIQFRKKSVICNGTINILCCCICVLTWRSQRLERSAVQKRKRSPTAPPLVSQQQSRCIKVTCVNWTPLVLSVLPTILFFAVSNHGLPEHGPGGTSSFFHSRAEGQREWRQRSQRFGVQTVSHCTSLVCRESFFRKLNKFSFDP